MDRGLEEGCQICNAIDDGAVQLCEFGAAAMLSPFPQQADADSQQASGFGFTDSEWFLVEMWVNHRIMVAQDGGVRKPY